MKDLVHLLPARVRENQPPTMEFILQHRQVGLEESLMLLVLKAVCKVDGGCCVELLPVEGLGARECIDETELLLLLFIPEDQREHIG